MQIEKPLKEVAARINRYKLKNMKKRTALLLLVVFVSSSCAQSSREKNAAPNPKSDNTRLTELLQTVLNSPGLIKLSKADLMREKYGKIFIFFNENVPKPDSLIYQKRFILEVTTAKPPENVPCYVFEKIKIHDNTAYVSLRLDITGFICYGNLKCVNGKWVPDNDFKIGYR